MNTTTDVLPACLDYIKTKLSASKDLSPTEIRQIVIEANVKEEDLMPWADFGHPVADSYGRKLVHHGGHFEIMVMSWVPGDFSTIHDHGYTEWGAVQVFGPAEHATFRVKDDKMTTLARWVFEPGDVVGVSHNLIHQMGNPTKDQRFLTLHVYGQMENIDSITGDAQVFDLDNEQIQFVDGGVFFGLPTKEIKSTTKAPKADFSTRLRHMLELSKRLLTMEKAGKASSEHSLQKAIEHTFSDKHLTAFLNQGNKVALGRTLKRELQEAANVQKQLIAEGYQCEHFEAYAQLYKSIDERFPILNDVN